MEGNIEAASLVVNEGATFNGKVTMKQADAKGKGAAPLKAIQGGTPVIENARAKARS